MATLGRRRFSITPETFDDYMADIEKESARAKRQYGMLVIPGAEVTQNHIRAKHNSHIVALGLKKFISADLKAKEILEEIRRQDAVSIACHPHHRTTTTDGNRDVLPVGSSQGARRPRRRLGSGQSRRFVFGDQPEALSRTWRTAIFTRPKHLYSWKTLVRSAKTWPAVKAALKANVDIAITLFRKEAC